MGSSFIRASRARTLRRVHGHSSSPNVRFSSNALPRRENGARRLAAPFGAGRPLTLVAVSGYGQPSDRDRSRAAGFAAHLVKPVSLAQLRAVMVSIPSD